MLVFRCAHCGAMNRVAEGKSGAPVCGRCKQTLETSGAPQEVDAAGLQRAIESSPVPVLVDFWAPWCGPCRQAAPVLDALSRQRAGRVLTLKLNTEEAPEVAGRFGIQGIPTFIVTVGGQERARQTGLPPPPQFARWIDSVVAAGEAGARA